MKICLTTDKRDAIVLLKDDTLKSINKVNNNVPVIENESDTNLTDNDTEFKVDVEDKHVNVINRKIHYKLWKSI